MPEKKLLMPGNSSFMGIMEADNYYVDKTLLVKTLLDNPAMVTLITRPRRFGKTMNMEMLRAYFDVDLKAGHYFEKLKIWKCGEKYTRHQGKYPVIYFSLKDVKGNDWNSMYVQYKDIIASTVDSLLIKGAFEKASEIQKERLKLLANRKADEAEYKNSLKLLCSALRMNYNEKVVILIDEYDVPIHEAHEKGYYSEALEFERTWLSGGLKDNGDLKFAVLTGVLRVAKESIFSDLNNLCVFSVFDELYAEYFGFTQEEVDSIAENYSAMEKRAEVKEWYDGYKFGNLEIYNPWSVTNYFASGCKPVSYWNKTSRNTIIESMLQRATPDLEEELRLLLEGTSRKVMLKDSIVYDEMDNTFKKVMTEERDTLFTLLVMTGYLKVTEVSQTYDDVYWCSVELPNREIKSLFAKEVLLKCTKMLPMTFATEVRFALKENNTEILQEKIKEFLLQSTSYLDTSQEVFYQGLLLGMSVIMYEEYTTSSNVESGYGRFDIQLKPRNIGKSNYPGIIFELKAVTKNVSDNNLEKMLQKEAEKAVLQIEEKEYFTELKAEGCKIILVYGMAFKGKYVQVVSKRIVI